MTQEEFDHRLFRKGMICVSNQQQRHIVSVDFETGMIGLLSDIRFQDGTPVIDWTPYRDVEVLSGIATMSNDINTDGNIIGVLDMVSGRYHKLKY